MIGNCVGGPQVGELANRVRDTLQTFGYFRAIVSEPTITIVDGSRHPQPVSLKVEFAEGARYRVREIVWSGMKALTLGISCSQFLGVGPETFSTLARFKRRSKHCVACMWQLAILKR